MSHDIRSTALRSKLETLHHPTLRSNESGPGMPVSTLNDLDSQLLVFVQNRLSDKKPIRRLKPFVGTTNPASLTDSTEDMLEDAMISNSEIPQSELQLVEEQDDDLLPVSADGDLQGCLAESLDEFDDLYIVDSGLYDFGESNSGIFSY
jgi:hypothetical protein